VHFDLCSKSIKKNAFFLALGNGLNMNVENYDKICTINSVEIFISAEFSEKKRKAIDELLHTQLKGLVGVSVGDMKYSRIILEPFICDNVKEYELVPGVYKYTSNNQKLHLLDKQISLRITENSIYYGFNSIFGVSIHFLYFLCVVLSGKTLVHSAAFKHKGKNILVPAFGGIGKTFLVSKLSENPETSIYGDDLVLLDADNNIFPYHRPMCVYKYHYEKYLKGRLPRKLYFLYPSLFWRIVLRIRLEILDRFGWKFGNIGDSCTHSKGYVTIAVSDILNEDQIPKVGEKLDIIVIIKRTSSADISVESIDKTEDRKQSAKYISSIVHHEWAEYHKLMLAYDAFTKRSTSLQFRATELLIEKAFIETNKVYLIKLPVNAKDSEIEQALNSIA